MSAPPPGHLERLALAAAAERGLTCADPLLLAEGTCTVVHLRPHPVVARVTRLAHLVRPPDAVAGALGLARALPGIAVPPSDRLDPGPHVVDGRFVTFWTHAEVAPATPAAAGAALRALHRAARAYPGPLRSFDPRPDALHIAALVGGQAGAVLRAAAEGMQVPTLAEQAVHGDAHVGNALADGRWLDFDDAARGPPEWDLACLRHCTVLFGERPRETGEALAAYGPFDEAAVAALDPLVVLFTAAWGALGSVVGEPIGPRTRRRLDWLRQRHGEG